MTSQKGWIPRHEHIISRKNIPENVLKVLYRLHQHGYQACLVGGAIRDLLSGLTPKDFDIATDAQPQEVRKLFRNSRLIGRRFQLVHVFFGKEIIEISTFRRSPTEAEAAHPFADNAYGSLLEDEQRRDFTINALYYDIGTFALRDGVGAKKDLENRCIRLIGDSTIRFQEDPARMLRAVRFAVRLQGEIELKTLTALKKNVERLQLLSSARLFDEWTKLVMHPQASEHCEWLYRLGLLRYLVPQWTVFAQKYALSSFQSPQNLAWQALLFLKKENYPFNSAMTFLMASFLWNSYQEELEVLSQIKGTPYSSYEQEQCAITAALEKQRKEGVVLPKLIEAEIRELWMNQKKVLRTWKNQEKRQLFLRRPKIILAVEFLKLLQRTFPTASQAKVLNHMQQCGSDSESSSPSPLKNRGFSKKTSFKKSPSRRSSRSLSSHSKEAAKASVE